MESQAIVVMAIAMACGTTVIVQGDGIREVARPIAPSPDLAPTV